MKLRRIGNYLPAWPSVVLAVASALLLTLAFPDFEIALLAWLALAPLLIAVDREKGSKVGSFVVGWVFGLVFFFATCWWLTFAPITYAGFPAWLAYLLLLLVCMAVAVFTGVFALVTSVLLRRFGPVAMLASPAVWVFSEFLRYWLTGNNWNAIGYSQAFMPEMIGTAAWGGVYAVGFLVSLGSAIVAFRLVLPADSPWSKWVNVSIVVLAAAGLATSYFERQERAITPGEPSAFVVAIQPNVPMSGLNERKWDELRQRHVALARTELERTADAERSGKSVVVIFPESPMNFMYETDPESQRFINGFAMRNDVSVLFNSAEHNEADGKFFNSAVMVSPEGREVVQYDKIYLLPFGEAVPYPFELIVPAFVGSFSYGSEYDLFPLGEAQAGVMICFESHFGQLSRQYALQGADVLIEMTNDGYLGPTPVLRQHLANAVFRTVETNRPMIRATNVGITAYIDHRGGVHDTAGTYEEAVRSWPVAKSDGSQTFYVRYGDWFAWLCSFITVGLLIAGWWMPKREKDSR